MTKISLDVATAEIESWLEKKKIRPLQKEANKESIDNLIESVMEGDLILNKETNCLTQNLLFPLGDNGTIKTLEYKARLNDKMVEPHMKGVKAGDALAMFMAHIAALTSTPKSVLSLMESVDLRIARSIAVFFM